MTPEEKMQELGLELKPVAIPPTGLLPWVQGRREVVAEAPSG